MTATSATPRHIRHAASVAALLLAAVLPASAAGPAAPGAPLPEWTEGFLDIHHINTGKGETSFIIMPDGTTMLVDVGVTAARPPWVAAAAPGASRSPGEWIARYILRMMKNAPQKRLHYVLLTHFHDDHMGAVKGDTPAAPSGAYKLSGVTEVAEHIPYETMLDRGWPDYNWPEPQENAKMANYKRFLAWQIKNKGLRVQRFHPGTTRQIVLRNNPAKYPLFQVRNIAVNGWVWTGVGETARTDFPRAEKTGAGGGAGDTENDGAAGTISENKLSAAFRLSHGAFDYYSGGDLSVSGMDAAGLADAWKDIEKPVARVTGPVEVAKANHHGNFDANSPAFLGYLRPRVIVIDSWAATQPGVNVHRRMKSGETYPGPRDIFVTNAMDANLLMLHAGKDQVPHGHIVIRVSPGGEEYFVHALDDTDERYRVKSTHGPYKAE
jgi:hypothetical protein